MDALVVASDKADARAAETTEQTYSSQARVRIEVVTLIPPATRHPTIFGALYGVAPRCGPVRLLDTTHRRSQPKYQASW